MDRFGTKPKRRPESSSNENISSLFSEDEVGRNEYRIK